jgi:hypothetical protein
MTQGTDMHGPHHLFCGGCNFSDRALAAAAWAGSLAATGRNGEAQSWAQTAKELSGKILMNWPYAHGDGEIQVRLIHHGDRNRPSSIELEGVIASLQIQLDAIRRCEAIEAERKAKAEVAAEHKSTEATPTITEP